MNRLIVIKLGVMMRERETDRQTGEHVLRVYIVQHTLTFFFFLFFFLFQKAAQIRNTPFMDESSSDSSGDEEEVVVTDSLSAGDSKTRATDAGTHRPGQCV